MNNQVSDREIELLNHLQKNNGIINKKNYSRKHSIARSTLYDLINSVTNKKLVRAGSGTGHYSLTNLANDYLEVKKASISPDRIIAKKEDLSTHFLKYKVNIHDKSFFSESRIKELNPLNYRKVKLPNFTQYHLYFDGATITINENTAIVQIHDMLSADMDEAHYKGFNTAIKHIDSLTTLGIKWGDLRLSQGHWARIESRLSEFLLRVDEHYYLELSNGAKLWVDHSKQLEDETNSPVVRENVDAGLLELASEDPFNFKIVQKAISQLFVISKNQIRGNELFGEELRAMKKEVVQTTKTMSSAITSLATAMEANMPNNNNVQNTGNLEDSRNADYFG